MKQTYFNKFTGQTVKTKELKRAKLYKKLFYNLVNNTDLKNYLPLIKFRISNRYFLKGNTSYSMTYRNRLTKNITKIVIKLDLRLLQDYIKIGFKSDYYPCRSLVLKFLKGNRKTLALFILLHEIKHALDKLKGVDFYYNNYNHEKNADLFAFEFLKQKGLINV